MASLHRGSDGPMGTQEQQLRFALTPDGVRIAYALTGRGYPLVRAAHWLGHLDFDWHTPIWRPWIDALSAQHALLRYDARGCGLSDPYPASITLDALVSDLEAAVDAAGLEHFALMGMSQGGAVSAVYAARHPERVSHLVLCGAFARGRLRRTITPEQVQAHEAMLKLVELGWGQQNPAFLQLFTSQFFPGASLVQMNAFNEIQRHAARPESAARIMRAFSQIDASAYLAQIRCPTLVLHSRGDTRVPFDEGRFVAASIPGARFLPLDTDNHVPLAGEPAFDRLMAEVADFLPTRDARAGSDARLAGLTARELDVLELIARGLDNAQVAAHLALAEKTVRNNITRIFSKIEVENRGQAIVLARNAGLGQ
ncbi:MAG: helix-turn-helix transcriptional regulator [Rubrivivax sp. SCN 70-15]|nr:MAG: helix-turn-helix transcriptional regulator [Rubrivivax sp. SCN 70-15]